MDINFDDIDKKSFAERLRLLRKLKKQSQTSLAEKIGTSRGAVQNWERAETSPKGITSTKLCKFLEVTPDYLFYGNGSGDAPQVANIVKYPIIEWEDVPHYKDFIGAEKSKKIKNHMSSLDNFGEDCFCLKIKSDAMLSSFPIGSTVLFKPIKKAKAGDYVLVTKGDIVDFRQLATGGFNQILKPLNHAYPFTELTPDIKIVAKAIKIENYIE